MVSVLPTLPHKIKAGNALFLRDGKGLAAPFESNGGERLARVRVEALGRVVHLRSGDSGVELLHGRRRAVHDRGARVDDRFETAGCGLGPDDGVGASGLPEAGRFVDLVVLDRAGVVLGVGAAEEQLGASGGELEAEHACGDDSLGDRGVEPWGLRVKEQADVRYTSELKRVGSAHT